MRRILLVAICCLTAVWSWGVPARRDARKVKQADGTVLTVYAHGDEHFSWLTNVEGQWIEQNAEGNYVVVDESRKRAMQHAYRVPEAVQTPVKLNRVPRGLVVLAEFQDVHFSTPKATMLCSRYRQ